MPELVFICVHYSRMLENTLWTRTHPLTFRDISRSFASTGLLHFGQIIMELLPAQRIKMD